MPADKMAALALFAFASSITPGPNNIMLTASGVNFGFRRTIPHMLGIGLGFMLLIACIGFGLGALFTAIPALALAVKVAGAIYMLWLAWKIANASEISEAGSSAKPLTFLEAAAFQWVNPKAWVMGISAIALYTRPGHTMVDVLTVVLIFGAINIPSVSVWAGFGHALRNYLSDPARMRVFNRIMALLLVISIAPMVM
ncbi:MAG: LysE family translocator [Bosea sp. (in: a-proteobacteria)]